MSTGSGGGPPHDAGVRRTGHPEGSVGEGRYADGVFPARFPVTDHGEDTWAFLRRLLFGAGI